MEQPLWVSLYTRKGGGSRLWSQSSVGHEGNKQSVGERGCRGCSRRSGVETARRVTLGALFGWLINIHLMRSLVDTLRLCPWMDLYERVPLAIVKLYPWLGSQRKVTRMQSFPGRLESRQPCRVSGRCQLGHSRVG
ncbi:hypothetical protein L1887_42372 [Cichorium endivia]|nr:hypothetical protein L1887_42372 [Cichorium endivia]